MKRVEKKNQKKDSGKKFKIDCSKPMEDKIFSIQ